MSGLCAPASRRARPSGGSAREAGEEDRQIRGGPTGPAAGLLRAGCRPTGPAASCLPGAVLGAEDAAANAGQGPVLPELTLRCGQLDVNRGSTSDSPAGASQWAVGGSRQCHQDSLGDPERETLHGSPEGDSGTRHVTLWGKRLCKGPEVGPGWCL